MIIRFLAAFAVGCAMLCASLSAQEAKHGPSTPEERKQALDSIHQWQADPLGPNAKTQFGWVLKWMSEIPDISVHVCLVLDKQPKGDKKDSVVIFGAEMLSQAAFLIENPDKRGDLDAEYYAGVLGSLQVYELLLKSKPADRQPYLDELIQRRTAGTLAAYVKERAASACKN
jgi:hypothetical protein